MSESAQSKSDEEDARQENGSVFDFLYQDNRRVGSFLAQIEDFGHLTRIKHTNRVGKTTSQKFIGSTEGAIPAFVSVKGGGEKGTSEDAGESADREYDTYWVNALALLDYLSQKELINRDLKSASIGQFVLVTGSLALFDMTFFQNVLKSPSMRKQALVENKLKDPKSKNNDTGWQLDLVGTMPHSIHASIQTADLSVWFTLDGDNLATKSGDLALKHGLSVAGDWAVLGVLDAKPDMLPSISDAWMTVPGYVEAARSIGMLGETLAQLAVATRLVLGRPQTSYGLTPLLVFRQLSG